MFENIPYISTHNHGDKSNLKFPDSICKEADLIDYAYSIGLGGIAITDHDCVSSYVRIGKHLAKRRKENPNDERWKNFKLIYGNEPYLCRNGMNKENYEKGKDRYFHFILLAKDEIGNRQIRELSTRAWQRSYMYFHRRVPTYYSDLDDIIGSEPGHVIASSACLGGFISTQIMTAQQYEDKDSDTYEMYYDAIGRWTAKMTSIFGDDFYLELQPGLSKEQIYVNKKLLELGKKLNIKCIITTDTHYLKAEDREIHKAYLNSKEGDREVDDFYEAAHMMTSQEIWDRVKDYMMPEDLQACFDNTVEIGNKCEHYDILKDLDVPYIPRAERVQVPNGDVALLHDFKGFNKFFNSPHVADTQLAIRLFNFLKNPKTYGNFYENAKVMDYELEVIWNSSEKQKVRWSKYLLQMADYIDIIWEHSLVCPGRGSAGASYVMYALDIIQVDKTREKAPLLFERFMNPERASVLDVDIDVESAQRDNCINALQEVYGKDRVVRVATFKTEKSKSAILAAARGLGIDVDISRYIASLIGSERGIMYSLSDMYYGNEESELPPNKTFVAQMKLYPKLWEVAQRIEGLTNGLGIHAGGVIIVDKPFTDSSAIMTTTKGVEISAFDLHDAEEVSLIKIDLLATEGLSKIRTCLDLLIEHGYIEKKNTLRETYEDTIGVYNLEREDKAMWEMVWNNQIVSLFQMEQQSGIQGISLAKPQSLEALATINSVMRLMAPERGAEQPLNKYARFRNDSRAWEREMNEYGLTTEEKELLHDMLDYSDGICAMQEDLYQLLTHPKIAGFGLGTADKLRKAVAKKNPADYKKFEDMYWKNAKEMMLSEQLCKYVWNVLIATQRG